MPRITDFQLVMQPAQPVISIRKTITVQQIPVILGESFRKLGALLEQQNELPVDIPFVAYHNVRNLDESHVEIEIGFPITRELSADGEITSYTLPESRKVFAMFRGDYGDMMPLYTDMWEWIKSNGYEDNNVAYESYYNGPEYPMEEMLTRVSMYIK